MSPVSILVPEPPSHRFPWMRMGFSDLPWDSKAASKHGIIFFSGPLYRNFIFSARSGGRGSRKFPSHRRQLAAHTKPYFIRQPGLCLPQSPDQNVHYCAASGLTVSAICGDMLAVPPRLEPLELINIRVSFAALS